MDQSDVAAQPGEVACLFHGRVAAADDHHVLPAKERTVTHRAGADALVLELLFRVEANVVGARAGRDDERLREVQDVLVFTHPDLERARGEIDLLHVRRDQLDALVLGLGAEVRHQVLPGNALGEAGKVLDLGREHQLPAGDQPARVEALDAQRLQVRARRVDRRGQAGRAGADDEYFVQPRFTHGWRSSICVAGRAAPVHVPAPVPVSDRNLVLTLLDQFFSRRRSYPFGYHEACRSARADTSQRENRRNRAPAASTTGRDAGRLGALTATAHQLPPPLELGTKVTK